MTATSTRPAHPAPTSGPLVRLDRREGVDEIRTGAYSVLLSRRGFVAAPYAILRDPDDRVWSSLNLLSSVHTLGLADETYAVEDYQLEVEDDRVCVVVRTSSSAWQEHETRLVCRPDALELTAQVTGAGHLTEVQLLGGVATMSDDAAGQFASSIDFASLLVPAPGEPVQLVRPSHSGGQVGLVGDADPGRLHAVFSPPPLVFGFGRAAPTGPTEVPPGDWLGLSLRAPVAELTFTTWAYVPLDGGFTLRLAYEGHTEVTGRWTSPVLVLRPAASGWDVLSDSRQDLVEHGCAPEDAPEPAVWWAEPLFCGWGAQCARVAAESRVEHGAGATPPVAPGLVPAGVHAPATVGGSPELEHHDHVVTSTAAGLSRADVYDEFLATMAAHDLHPGTVVLDDRWQRDYGTAEPDPEHWPDLRDWIARRHDEGLRVLLWWKAWDPAGLPPEECVTDAGGRPVAADPANPRYRARLTEVVRRLVAPDGLDADGFKIDFSQHAPSGSTLRGTSGAWGIAALHLLLATLHDAAKSAKPDALVVCHTVHPAFGDVCDMVRLNDLAKTDVGGRPVPVVDQLRLRHEIVRRTLPGHLVDTDQWPMPDRAEWRRYVDAQAELGVPALYYLESIDRSGEPLDDADLAAVAASWRRYRQEVGR